MNAQLNNPFDQLINASILKNALSMAERRHDSCRFLSGYVQSALPRHMSLDGRGVDFRWQVVATAHFPAD